MLEKRNQKQNFATLRYLLSNKSSKISQSKESWIIFLRSLKYPVTYLFSQTFSRLFLMDYMEKWITWKNFEFAHSPFDKNSQVMLVVHVQV